MRGPILLVLLALAACGPARTEGDPDPGSDAGPVDAGSSDAGVSDAGPADAGPGCLGCEGCCTTEGACLAGDDAAACGRGGALCADCGAETCVAGACEAAPIPEGDGCDEAIELVRGSDGIYRGSVNLAGYADDAAASCGPGGADAVFAFDVDDDDTYLVATATGRGSAKPAIAVRSDCGLRRAELGCSTTGLDGRVAAGRYFAWVEASGSGSVDVAVSLVAPKAGDSCDRVRTLTLSNGAATLRDSLGDYGPDELACDGGADAVYAFTLAAASTVKVTVTPRAARFDPALQLMTTCGADAPACTGAAPGAVETIERLLPAGTHHVVVSSVDGSVGDFDLAITATPQVVTTGETCEQPLDLPLDASGQGSVTFPTRTRTDDFDLSCMVGSGGRDGAYRIHLTETSDLRATVRDGSGTSFSALALRSTCGGPDLGCGSVLDLANVPPGDYVLLVETWSGETDNQSVTVKFSPPKPAGETCARAIPIALTGGAGHVAGSFTGVADDVDGTVDPDCTGLRGAVDLFYSITLDHPQMVTTTLARTGTAGSVELGLIGGTACATGYTEECRTATTAVASVQALLLAGPHLVRVQGLNAAGFVLDVTAVDPAPGEFCDVAVDVTFAAGGGTQTFTGTTKGSTQENFNNACMGYDRPDRVYAITLADPYSNLTITTTPVGSAAAPGFILVDECRQIVPEFQSCGTTQATRKITAPALAAGTWHVWVKGPEIAGADYTIRFDAKPTPAGDVCSVAIPVVTTNGGAGGTAHLTGDTTGASDDYTACRQISPAFSDLVYAITLDEPRELRLKMTPAAGAKGALTLRDEECRDSPDICAPFGYTTEATTTLKTALAAGTHYVSVDHTQGGPGPFTLDVDLSAPRAGENCENPLPLDIPASGGHATITVDLRDFSDAETNDCFGRGADAYYQFTTDRPLDLRVKTTSTGGSPKIEVGSACTFGCNLAGPTWEGGSLPAGTHFLIVDTEFPRDEQVYTLEVALTPPTPGDTCDVAIPLNVPATGGTATITGSTKDAFSEFYNFTCTSSYPDRVYSFTTTRTLSLVANVRNATGAKSPAVALNSGTCSASATPTTCDAGKRDASYVRAADLAPGTYYLVVDRSDYAAPDEFTLEVSLGDRPAGDTCATALPLGLPAGPGEVTVHGDTRAFFHDLTPSCGASTGAKNAPEVLYAFTLTEPRNLRVLSHATTAGFRPTVALRKGCGTTDSDQRCAWTPTFSPDTWTDYENLPAGKYFLAVDGFDHTQGGAFDLTVRTTPANAPGDTCANPAPLTLSNGTSGRATATGAFTDWFDHLSDCWNNDGADVVYSFTTDRARKVHAVVSTSEQTAGATVSLRKSPCAQTTSQVACERPSYDGTARVVADVAAGTTYVIVKSPLAWPKGTYTLDLRVDDFEPGDTCAGALPLSFPNGADGGAVHVTGNSYAFVADATLTCDSSEAPDAYYAFTTTKALNLTAKVTRENTSEGYAIALFPGCSGAQRACVSSGFSSAAPTLTQPALPAGSWVLVVRGGTAAPTGYALDVTLAP